MSSNRVRGRVISGLLPGGDRSTVRFDGTSHFFAAAWTSAAVTLSRSLRMVLMRFGIVVVEGERREQIGAAEPAALEVLEERRSEIHLGLLQLLLGDPVLLDGVDHLVHDLQDVRAFEVGTVVDAEGVEHRTVVVEVVAEAVVERRHCTFDAIWFSLTSA